mmetsp:Transcript_112071/g.317378  ORF Transcript_112071/g.317378 Transcript_112071/m.317378 type:complete len:476 (-) Transcript_112071:53-1480(-)
MHGYRNSLLLALPLLSAVASSYVWDQDYDLASRDARALAERPPEGNTTDDEAPGASDAAPPRVALAVVLLSLVVVTTGVACAFSTRQDGGKDSESGDSDEEDSGTENRGSDTSDEDQSGEDSPAKLVKTEEPSRNWPLQIGIVTIFVVAGSAQALAVAAARGSGHNLPFDFAVAVFCTEAMKLMVAVGWLLGTGCPNFVCPPPRSWLWETLDLSTVAALFALQNELNYLVITFIGAVLFTILGNMKIVFTAIFMRCMLGKEFATLQWVAIGMLTFSAMVVKAPDLAGMSDDKSSPSWLLGVVLLLANTMSAGFAGVRNELIFKRTADNGCCDPAVKMPFMMQNAVLYVWGLILNFSSWYIWGQHPFMQGIGGAAWVAIASAAIFGLMCAMMLKFLDNAVRCFASVAQLLFTVVVSRMFPAHFHVGSFDYFYVASLVLLVAALVVYQQHNSANLPKWLAGAIISSLCVGLLCHFLG